MKIIKFSEGEKFERPYGRVSRVLLEHKFKTPVESIIFYHSDLPNGKFDDHYHSESEEIIWFPEGGKITVEGETIQMEPWDGVLLQPGEQHGYSGESVKTIHLAVKMPASNDKVSAKDE